MKIGHRPLISFASKKILSKWVKLAFPPLICYHFGDLGLHSKFLNTRMIRVRIITSTTMVVDKFRSVQKITKPILKISKSFVKQTHRQTDRQGLLLKFLRNLKISLHKKMCSLHIFLSSFHSYMRKTYFVDI